MDEIAHARFHLFAVLKWHDGKMERSWIADEVEARLWGIK